MSLGCIICVKNDRRKLGLSCVDCGLYYHRSCLNLDREEFKLLLESESFTCLSCKQNNSHIVIPSSQFAADCLVCMRSDKRKAIIKCSQCEQSFHKACVHNSMLKREVRKDAWICTSCLFPFASLEDHLLDTVLISAEETNLTSTSLISAVPLNLGNFEFKKGLRIGHLNVNGLYDKLDSINVHVHTYDFDVLLLSETHLRFQQDYPNLNIPGYSFKRFDRPRSWGGLGYLAKDQEHIQMRVLSSQITQNEIEMLCLSLKVKNIAPIMISCVYRNPGHSLCSDSLNNVYEFFNKMQIEFPHREHYLMGDLNVDLLKPSNHSILITQLFSSLGLTQIIDKPTRSTTTTATLIDHIYVSTQDYCMQSGVLTSGISDHDLVFLVRKKKKAMSCHTQIAYRNYKHFSADGFREDVQSFDWRGHIHDCSPNLSVERYESALENLIEKHAPTVRRSIRVEHSPWIDNEATALMKTRDRARCIAKSTGNSVDINCFKRLRNACNILCRKKKRLYFKNLFEKASDSQSYWKAYKKLIGNNKKSCSIAELKVGDNIVSSPSEIAQDTLRIL